MYTSLRRKTKIGLAILFWVLLSGYTTVRVLKDAAIDTNPVINAQACNAAVWTGWSNVYTMGAIHYEIAFNDSLSAATATGVSFRCETSNSAATANDAGADLHGFDGGTFAAGALTIQTGIANYNNALGAGAPNSETWTVSLTNLPNYYVNCRFICGGAPTAGDLITVRVLGESP